MCVQYPRVYSKLFALMIYPWPFLYSTESNGHQIKPQFQSRSELLITVQGLNHFWNIILNSYYQIIGVNHKTLQWRHTNAKVYKIIYQWILCAESFPSWQINTHPHQGEIHLHADSVSMSWRHNLLVVADHRGILNNTQHISSSNNFISRRMQYNTFHRHNISTISQCIPLAVASKVQSLTELTTVILTMLTV